MPKEFVPDVVSPDGTWRFEVMWKPAAGDIPGHVQIATVVTTGLRVDGANARTVGDTVTVSVGGGARLVLPGDSDGDPVQPFTGWFVTLDRDGINHGIRLLRRARDAAFGRDE